MPQMSPQTGFTIIELMVTVTVLAILLGMGVPAMTNMMKTQRVKTAATELHLAMVYARSEAIKRGLNVNIVPDDASDWTDGWTIVETGGSAILKDQDELTGTVDVDGPNGNVTFSKLGRTNAAATFEVTIPGNTYVRMRCVTASLSGRPYTKIDYDPGTSGCQ